MVAGFRLPQAAGAPSRRQVLRDCVAFTFFCRSFFYTTNGPLEIMLKVDKVIRKQLNLNVMTASAMRLFYKQYKYYYTRIIIVQCSCPRLPCPPPGVPLSSRLLTYQLLLSAQPVSCLLCVVISHDPPLHGSWSRNRYCIDSGSCLELFCRT